MIHTLETNESEKVRASQLKRATERQGEKEITNFFFERRLEQVKLVSLFSKHTLRQILISESNTHVSFACGNSRDTIISSSGNKDTLFDSTFQFQAEVPVKKEKPNQKNNKDTPVPFDDYQ